MLLLFYIEERMTNVWVFFESGSTSTSTRRNRNGINHKSQSTRHLRMVRPMVHRQHTNRITMPRMRAMQNMLVVAILDHDRVRMMRHWRLGCRLRRTHVPVAVAVLCSVVAHRRIIMVNNMAAVGRIHPSRDRIRHTPDNRVRHMVGKIPHTLDNKAQCRLRHTWRDSEVSQGRVAS